MGNCLHCRFKTLSSPELNNNASSRCVQTIGSPFSRPAEAPLKTSRYLSMTDSTQSGHNDNCYSSELDYNRCSSSPTNSNNNFVILGDRNNNRHASLNSSFQNIVSSRQSFSRQHCSTNIPRSSHRLAEHLSRQARRNKHVFCDSSLDTESNSNDSTHCDSLKKDKTTKTARSSLGNGNSLFLISRIPPPSPVPVRKKIDVLTSTPLASKSRPREENKPAIEYTFYVEDRDKCRLPLLDNRVQSVVIGYNCSLKLHGHDSKGDLRKVFYKGNSVIPVTIRSDNMTGLRKCIGRLDNQFPYFNVKAFLNS